MYITKMLIKTIKINRQAKCIKGHAFNLMVYNIKMCLNNNNNNKQNGKLIRNQ